MSEPDTTTSSSSSDVRVSTLIGDRLCVRCGYNLVGQPILREQHYQMLIIRCPECATVASVQEYPLLGRWVARWAAVLASLWLLFLVGLWLGSAGAIFGFAVGSAELASEAYGDHIYQQFNAWQVQQQSSGAVPGTGGGSGISGAAPGQTIVIGPAGTRIVTTNTSSFGAWWQTQDHALMLADAGGMLGGINRIVYYLWMWQAIVAAVIGVVWATVLIGRGRGGLLLWGAILIVTAAAIGLIPTMDWLSGTPTWTHQAAARQVAPMVMAISLGWAALWLVAGLMIGRPVARGLIRLLLPPRMRSSLAFLWLCDDRRPPTTR